MTKKNWSVSTPGYAPFPMLALDEEFSHAEALAWARSIWPLCTVE